MCTLIPSQIILARPLLQKCQNSVMSSVVILHLLTCTSKWNVHGTINCTIHNVNLFVLIIIIVSISFFYLELTG